MSDTVSHEPAAREEASSAVLQAENEAMRDRMLRALAEAENTRARAERRAEETRQFAISDFARELLVVADNLDLAIAAAEERPPQAACDAALLEGVRATRRVLQSVFEHFGVRKLEPLGARFDPNQHEAVMEVADEQHAPGTVAKVLGGGYTLRDRLLRPARVAVSRRIDDAEGEQFRTEG
jgi:molecular chaperone GrpE